jgi:hypothetical protein
MTLVPNLFTGKLTEVEVFQIISMANYNLEENSDIVISNRNFRQHDAFARLSVIPKIGM